MNIDRVRMHTTHRSTNWNLGSKPAAQTGPQCPVRAVRLGTHAHTRPPAPSDSTYVRCWESCWESCARWAQTASQGLTGMPSSARANAAKRPAGPLPTTTTGSCDRAARLAPAAVLTPPGTLELSLLPLLPLLPLTMLAPLPTATSSGLCASTSGSRKLAKCAGDMQCEPGYTIAPCSQLRVPLGVSHASSADCL